nr:hypothetical protein [Tanacetum cinerariifolium]
MLLSPQHAGFGELKLKSKIMSPKTVDHTFGASQDALKDQGYFNSGCSRYMIGNISYLTGFKEHNGGYVAFREGAKSGKITGKGTIRTATKDDTSRILKSFITEIENLVGKKVKIIRCDNGTEFKNRVMNEFCKEKGIKREYNVARTPQQNGIAERRNRTLIEAAKTVLANSKLPTPFWVEVVSTACYVQNKLGKFDEKSDEGIFVGYSTTSKDFRVYNIRTRKVEENLHITFLENKPMIAGGGPEWLFDMDALLKSMNYAPVSAGRNSNDFTGKGESFDACQSIMEIGSSQDYILMTLWKDNSLFDSSSQASISHNKDKHGPSQASESDNHERPNAKSSTKTINTARPVNTATPTYADYPNEPLMLDLKDDGIFDDAYDDRDKGAEMEPKKVTQALDDESWVKAMQEELLWLVAQGHRQEEGIDYDEVFGPVARIEAIRLFLAYASFMDFTVYQIDVKSACLYGTIKEEVYVSQPPGFMDPEFPNRVYKVEKALYGLHQAPRAWYETLSTYVLDNRFRRGTIEKTLFIKKIKDEILLVQVPDIMFAVCACSRFQVQLKIAHMHAVKRIFRYLKGQPTLGLWYPKDSPLELIAYSDSDYAGARLELKGYLINDGYADLVQHKKELAIPGQTATGKEFLNPLMAGSLPKTTSAKSDDNRDFHQIVDFISSCSITYALTVSPTIYASYIEQFWNTASSKTINSVKQIHVIVDGKAVVIFKSSVRSDLFYEDEDCITCLTNDEIFENLSLMGYEPLSTKLTFQKGGSPRHQDTMGVTFAQTRSERVLEQPNDSPLSGGYTLGSDEGRLKLKELMVLYTTLVNRVTTLENKLSTTKAVYHKAFITFIKKGRMIEELDKDEDVNLVGEKGEVRETAETSKDDDATLAEIMLNIRRSSAKDKGKGIMQETERPKKLKKKEMIQLSLDEELAQKLYAKELAKEATRQDQERYNLEKGFELQRQLDQRKEDAAKGNQAKKIDWNNPTVLRYHALQNRPFSKDEVRKNMIMYLKNQGEEEVEAQGDSDKEIEEIKLYMKIIPNKDIAIDAIPLATKPLVIVKYKIVKKGKISTYLIVRAYGSTKRYTSMINLLENIDRDDLETLGKLVQDKLGDTRLEGVMKECYGEMSKLCLSQM